MTNQISVALPVLNGEKYIKEALDSILNQKYKDFDIVILDNASTDLTPGILKLYSEKHPQIKVFRNETILPIAENMSKVVEFCTSDWVQLFCYDDIMLPDCIETIVGVINTLPQNSSVALMGHSGSFLFANNIFHCPTNKTNKILQWTGKNTDEQIEKENSFFPKYKSVTDMINFRANIHLPAVTTAVVKRSVFANRDYFVKGYLHFDIFTWTEMLFDFDYIFINKALTVTRIHGNQVAVDARKSLRTIEDFKLFWTNFISTKKIIKTTRIVAFTTLKPIAASATILYTLLAKKNYKLFFKTYFSLPKSWYPVLPFFVLRIKRYEQHRLAELSKVVPIELIYP